MTSSIAFFVHGTPRPGGSKNAWPIYRGKKGEKREFTGKVALQDASGPAGKEWRRSVRERASTYMREHGLESFVEVPLRLDVEFHMPRPKAHYVASNRARDIKANAPTWHICKPDRTKLLRALEDALTGILWADDTIVATGWVSKRYAHLVDAGAQVSVTPL